MTSVNDYAPGWHLEGPVHLLISEDLQMVGWVRPEPSLVRPWVVVYEYRGSTATDTGFAMTLEEAKRMVEAS